MKLERNFSILCDNLVDTVIVQDYLFSMGYHWSHSVNNKLEFSDNNLPMMFNIEDKIITWDLYRDSFEYYGIIYDSSVFLRKSKLEKLSML